MSYADIYLDDATRQCKCTCCIELVNAVDHNRPALTHLRCSCRGYSTEEQCACARCQTVLARFTCWPYSCLDNEHEGQCPLVSS